VEEVRQVVGPGPDADVQRPELGVLRSAIQACLPLRFLPFCCCHNMKKTRDRQAKQITQVPIFILEEDVRGEKVFREFSVPVTTGPAFA